MQPLVAALLTDVLCALVCASLSCRGLAAYPSPITKAAHRWFNTFEPTANATFFLILAALPSVAVALLISESRSLLRAICVAYPVFYGTLLSSIVAYRVSRFHPLAKYPGPLLCKVSQLWTVWITSRGQLHVYHKELHDRYGSIVRIGMHLFHLSPNVYLEWCAKARTRYPSLTRISSRLSLARKGCLRGLVSHPNLTELSHVLTHSSLGGQGHHHPEVRKRAHQRHRFPRHARTRPAPEALEQSLRQAPDDGL